MDSFKIGGLLPMINYFQDGGQMQQLQQQLMQLIQAAQSGDQQAAQQLNEIYQQAQQAAQQGNQQAQQVLQIIQQAMGGEQQGTPAARYGAKLAYIYKLKNGCGMDEEILYQRCGGKTVKKVAKKCTGSKMKKC